VRLTPVRRGRCCWAGLVEGQISAGRRSLEQRGEIIRRRRLDDLTRSHRRDREEDADICRAINRGLAEQRLVEINTSPALAARWSPVYRAIPGQQHRGQWYLVACAACDAIRTRFEMIRAPGRWKRLNNATSTSAPTGRIRGSHQADRLPAAPECFSAPGSPAGSTKNSLTW
jgi:hypothetical protein